MTMKRTIQRGRTELNAYASALAMAILAATTASAQSQSNENVSTVNCAGTLSGSGAPFGYADVIVNGGSCILQGVVVHGSVKVGSGGSLTMRLGTQVRGGVEVKSGANAIVQDSTVSGDLTLENSGDLAVRGTSTLKGVKVKNSGNVTVAAGASTGELMTEGAGNITVNGLAASIVKNGSGSVTFRNGSRTFPGGVTVITGSLTLCGAEIGMQSDGINGSGGVNVVLGGAVRAVSGTNCGASSIQGSVIVDKGTGDVRFVDTVFPSGDLIVIERNGTIRLENTSLSDVKLEKNTGPIVLVGLTTDSDSTIADNDGSVTISQSTFGGDVEIKNGGDVSIADTSFNLEDVTVSFNEGVAITNNQDFNVSIFENDTVLLMGNTLTNADVSKNSGSVSIIGNIGAELKCTDNSAPPIGSGNGFTELTDGQCAGF